MVPVGNTKGYQAAGDPDRLGWNGLTKEQRTEYIEKYSSLIRFVAERLAARLPSHISREDLISAGIIGLIDAVDKFDPRREIMFKTYAEFRIRGAMLDELRSLDWVPRSVRKKNSLVEKAYQRLEAELGRPATDEEVSTALGLSLDEFHHLLDEVKTISLLDIETFRGAAIDHNRNNLFDLLADENGDDPLSMLGLEEARAVVAEAISNLPEKESLVVSMYYYDELTMKEIGEIMDYTESRISQLHTKALLRLKARLRHYFDSQGK